MSRPTPVAPAQNPSDDTGLIDARSFGVVANGKDCSVGLQKAVDHAISSVGPPDGAQRRAVVFVAPSLKNYILENPVWIDSSRVEIVGGGIGRTVFQTGQFPARPAFIVGLPRGSGAFAEPDYKEKVGQISASDRFDLKGILDTSFVSAPSSKFGLRLPKEGMVQVQVGPLVRCWDSMKQMTLEFCIASRDSKKPLATGHILGRGNGYVPAPWLLRSDMPGRIVFDFKTDDLAGDNHLRRSLVFPVSGPGPYRVSLQVDLVQASAQAYVNGKQVKIDVLGEPWKPGHSFVKFDSQPFIIGESESVEGIVAKDRDLSLLGFLVSDKLRYKDSGVGSKQVSSEVVPGLSGGIPNDSYRYGPGASHQSLSQDIVTRFLANEAPASLDRLISFQQGNGAFGNGFVGYLLNKNRNGTSAKPGISGNALRKFTVVANSGLNQGIAIGMVLDFTLEEIRSSGCWHGIGSINLGANYTIDVINCRLSGRDAAYYGFWQLVRMNNLNIESYESNAVRLVGSSSSIRGCFVGDSNQTECFFKFQTSAYGGQHVLDGITINTEGNSISNAAIYMEQHPYAQSMLTVRDSYIGTTGKAPIIRLHDFPMIGNGLYEGTVIVENVSANSTAPFLDINGPSWHGRVQIPPGYRGKGVNDRKTNSGPRHIQILDPPGRKERQD